MKDPRELKLNTLDRYSKKSSRLILQSYSHCEVPAGCGGVVFRWVDPDVSLPMLLTIECSAPRWTLSLDGEAHTGARLSLSPGRHVLTLALSESAVWQSFRLRIAYDASLKSASTRALPTSAVQSAGDGEWLAAYSDPGSDFTRDREPSPEWKPLGEVAASIKRDYAPRGMEGARWIGDRAHKGALWVRRVLTVTADGDRWELA